MNKSLMPTVNAYVSHSVNLNNAETELMQIERQLLEAKKSKIFAYNKGESTKLKSLDETIKGLTIKKAEQTKLFEESCRSQFYMYSTYINASASSTIGEISDLIKEISSKINAINLESQTLEKRKAQLLGLANSSEDSETTKKCRELSAKCHSMLVDLTMRETIYIKVKNDVTEVLKKKQEESTPQMR